MNSIRFSTRECETEKDLHLKDVIYDTCKMLSYCTIVEMKRVGSIAVNRRIMEFTATSAQKKSPSLEQGVSSINFVIHIEALHVPPCPKLSMIAAPP